MKWPTLMICKRTRTPRKRYKPEEIVGKLRHVDVHLSQGIRVADAIQQIGASEVTYYLCGARRLAVS